jgi:translation initiation factor 4E
MEPAAEKETEQEEQQLPQARKDDAPTAAATAAVEDGADSEETERRNRDLKAGLHPLRVRNAAADRSSAPRSASH